jgi:hypothetical protein
VGALANMMVPVSEESIRRAVDASEAFPRLDELLVPEVQERLAQEVLFGI